MTAIKSGNRSTPERPEHPVYATRQSPSEIEAWTLECLRRLTTHYGRAPSLVELSNYCSKSITPIYLALKRLETKGYVERRKTPGTPGKGRFHVVE